MDIITVITGIIGTVVGFGIAKIIEKSNISNLIKNAKKEAASILKDATDPRASGLTPFWCAAHAPFRLSVQGGGNRRAGNATKRQTKLNTRLS